MAYLSIYFCYNTEFIVEDGIFIWSFFIFSNCLLINPVVESPLEMRSPTLILTTSANQQLHLDIARRNVIARYEMQSFTKVCFYFGWIGHGCSESFWFFYLLFEYSMFMRVVSVTVAAHAALPLICKHFFMKHEQTRSLYLMLLLLL